MENITLMNSLLAFLGVLMYTLIQYKKRKSKESFSFGYWLQDNIIDVILSIAATLAILLLAGPLVIYLALTQGGAVTPEYAMMLVSFAGGLMNQAIIRWIMKKIKGKLK